MKFKKCILLILIIIFIIIFLDDIWIQTTTISIKSNKIPESFNDFNILQISDLHNKSFGKDNSILISKINKVDPDIIVFTGDMFSYSEDFNSIDTKTFISLVDNLNDRYPLYYVDGNHEQYAKWLSNYKNIEWYNNYINILRDMNVKILNNKSLRIEKSSEYINIYGLTIPLSYYSTKNIQENLTTSTISNILGELYINEFNILLAHNPIFFPVYNEWGADLTLSGHIHGGIIRIPFVGGIFSPDRTLFPKYDSGKYTLNNHTLVVSRGLGGSPLKIRFLNRPQLIVIKLEN